MFQEERHIAILQHIKQHQRISVQDICDLYKVSRDTARLDVVTLEEQGLLIRTRGGAILPTLTKTTDSYENRLNNVTAEKTAIARLAASLITNGDYLMFDVSTTVQLAAEYISTQNHFAVTNSIDIASVLCKKENIRIHLLGGQLDVQNRYVTGAKTLEMLADYHVDKLFLGACGISKEGLTSQDESDAYLNREMIKRADQVIVLADHSKFSKRFFYKVCDLNQVDLLITDKALEGELKQLFDENEIEVKIIESK
jgi:DeoR/GlpR family transcriptional regulator of sugar metabolism